jgi:hypothetical protein
MCWGRSRLPGTELKAFDQAVDRRDDNERQQCGRDHAADHRHCDALHDFRPSTRAPHDEEQARHDGDHRHHLGPHAINGDEDAARCAGHTCAPARDGMV